MSNKMEICKRIEQAMRDLDVPGHLLPYNGEREESYLKKIAEAFEYLKLLKEIPF